MHDIRYGTISLEEMSILSKKYKYQSYVYYCFPDSFKTEQLNNTISGRYYNQSYKCLIILSSNPHCHALQDDVATYGTESLLM
jgi:hypothetical protein